MQTFLQYNVCIRQYKYKIAWAMISGPRKRKYRKREQVSYNYWSWANDISFIYVKSQLYFLSGQNM